MDTSGGSRIISGVLRWESLHSRGWQCRISCVNRPAMGQSTIPQGCFSVRRYEPQLQGLHHEQQCSALAAGPGRSLDLPIESPGCRATFCALDWTGLELCSG
ncbi:hypothetical protein AOLI_G00085370 [Acnodon oligacanthus]